MRHDRRIGPRTRTLPSRAWLAAALAAAGVGCGNLTAGGATGEAVLYVTGDAPDVTFVSARPAGVLSRSQHAAARSGDDSRDDPEGEIELEFTVDLVTDAGVAVPLTTEEVRVRVEFPGDVETEVVTRTVPARRYPSLRVTFTEIEVEVDAGLVIDGVPVTGPVDVELEGDALVVERPLDLDVAEGATAELLLDMNAAAWLSAIDPDLHVVSGAIVGTSIQVRER